jgi:CMP-N-acetylneuraminic acid synthetase
MNIAMIPARMGSQRLARKNLAPLMGVPLIVHAIRKCQETGMFERVVVNSEHPDFGPIAKAEGAEFHQRPEALGSNTATSEDFVEEFLNASPCERLFQVHSIAPLLTAEEVKGFATAMIASDADVFLSVVDDQLEAFCRGEPVNFTLKEKTNSQDLPPVRKVSWAITGWRRETFLKARKDGACATYAGKVELYPVSKIAGHVIKTAEDLAIAEALFPLVHGKR